MADGIEEAHKVCRDMKVWKHRFGGGGSIKRGVKCSTDVKRNGGARGGGRGSSARNKSLVVLRDVRESGSEP